MPLKDLVVYLANRVATGTLVLERGSTRKQLVLDAGHVINASSNQPCEYLGQFLINLGHITEEQLAQAFETQRTTQVFLGRILVMTEAASEEIIAEALALKFKETILEAFTWEDGDFSFQADLRPTQPAGVTVLMPLLDVHKEADFRSAAWQQIRSVFPSTDCTLTVKRDNLVDTPKPGSIDEAILEGAERGQTLNELALRLHATDFFLYQRLYALNRLGVIAVGRPAQPESFDIDVDLPVDDASGADALLTQARRCVADGNLRDAYALGRRAEQVEPSQEGKRLLKDLEVAWQPQLALTLLATPRVPTLVLPAEEARALPLSAAERYLLSRIDGQRKLADIIGVAPLREFDALAFVDRFVHSGWIRLS